MSIKYWLISVAFCWLLNTRAACALPGLCILIKKILLKPFLRNPCKPICNSHREVSPVIVTMCYCSQILFIQGSQSLLQEGIGEKIISFMIAYGCHKGSYLRAIWAKIICRNMLPSAWKCSLLCLSLIFWEGHPKKVEKGAQKSSGPDPSFLISSHLILSTSEPGRWSDFFAYGHTHHLKIRLVVALWCHSSDICIAITIIDIR